MKLKRYIKEVLVFSIVMLVFSNIISLYNSQDLSKQPLKIGSYELLDGSKFELKTGQTTLVHFWASWCKVCSMEAQNIQTLSEHFNVLTIAVKSGTNQQLQKHMQENNLSFNTYNDYDGELANCYNLGAYPTTFIYNKKGVLVFSEVGYTSTLGLWMRMLWSQM